VSTKSNPCSETIHAIRDGFSYCIRPIAKDDRESLIELFNQLSPENRYLRFAHAISKLPDAFLEDVLELDYKKEMALVAVITHNDSIEKIIGIARYVAKESEDICEFSISVGDEYATHGVGTNLMKRLINHAQQQNLKKMIGYILNDNIKMLKMVKELGFHINTASPETGFKISELDLNN
jgi:acetyltransferase